MPKQKGKFVFSSMAHNHPTGDPTPSRDDIAMTREVKKALEVVGSNCMII